MNADLRTPVYDFPHEVTPRGPVEPLVMAIDPGLTGAVAFFFPTVPDRARVEDMPVCDGEVNVAALMRMIRQMGPTLAVVELVGPMPTDGAVPAFRFGAAYAAAKAAVTACEVPMRLVTPAKWKRALRLAGGKEGKEQARALALQRFPASADRFARKADHGRAEAALLAAYGAETFITPSQAAARSGCAGNGEARSAASPELALPNGDAA